MNSIYKRRKYTRHLLQQEKRRTYRIRIRTAIFKILGFIGIFIYIWAFGAVFLSME